MQKIDSLQPEKAWHMCRTIRLAALTHPADAMAIERALQQKPGIIRLQTDVKKKRLRIIYDVTVADLATIVDLLEGAGFPPENNWQWRLKYNWYTYLDENAKANAKAPAPPCCNKPPK